MPIKHLDEVNGENPPLQVIKHSHIVTQFLLVYMPSTFLPLSYLPFKRYSCFCPSSFPFLFQPPLHPQPTLLLPFPYASLLLIDEKLRDEELAREAYDLMKYHTKMALSPHAHDSPQHAQQQHKPSSSFGHNSIREVTDSPDTVVSRLQVSSLPS